MTTLKFYNSRTRRKEDFVPIDAQNVRMYVCGPTVYDRAHLGNARPVIVFDVLYRLLRHVYGADHVTYVRNFTDVDDKINARAAESGRPIGDITAETTQWFLDDMAKVGALEPSIKDSQHERAMPRATHYIGQMVAMIEQLIADGFAYAKEGHVLFRVRSYEEYGKLSGRSVDDMIAGARVEVAPYKEDPMDFVLWKPSDDATPGWDSPWGRGRPGWHIECSAMAHDLLGSDFDIHGGGNDLMFPHHENEIAQSKCAGHGFANVWLHNEMLQVEGKKMSKSLGNFFTVRDLLDQGVPGEVIRFVMLSTHYRKPMDWTEKKREEAEKTLRKWGEALVNTNVGQVSLSVLAPLSKDLDTHGAINAINRLIKEKNYPEALASAQLLGMMTESIDKWREPVRYTEATGEKLDQVIKVWGTAMASKDYDAADSLRAKIDRAAIVVDAGLRVTDPLKFVRSLSETERQQIGVSYSEFLANPQLFSDRVDAVMSARADCLLEALK